MVDYIYLDTDERRRFAQYLTNILLNRFRTKHLTGSPSFELNFNHPVKELIWADTYENGDYSGNEIVTGDKESALKLNGHDRLAERDFTYFTSISTGMEDLIQHSRRCWEPIQIAVYSFALKPEEHQPWNMQFLKNW